MSQTAAPEPPVVARVINNTNTLKIVLIVLGIMIFFALIGCGVLAALLLPAISAAREAAQRQQGMNNLKQIGLAIHNYESTYKKIPALHGINHEGAPTGSWRVAILPFIEQSTLYGRFDFHKPWDAAENQSVANQMPSVYRSMLADKNQPPNNTNYFAIVAPKSTMPTGGVYRKFGDITDGLSNTIVAVELPDHSLPWTEPNDLTVAEVLQHIHASSKPKLINLLMLDGSVIAFGNMSDKDFEMLVSVNDGNVVALPDR